MHYESELAKLSDTYATAIAADVSSLRDAIAECSEFSLIGCGSGGSFTAAMLLCNLHEAYTGRVSRPSTPLEIICNPTLASSSPVFLISAEGKNPDILEALDRARIHSARSVHVLTNRLDSPLMARASELPDVKEHHFVLQEKDGFLATNSLLFNATLIAKAYGELDLVGSRLPSTLDELRVGNRSISEWLEGARALVESIAGRGSVIVVFSPLLRAIAADLESKLSEAALCYVQLADLRSFAHGRHLWLAQCADECSVLAIVEPTTAALWHQMLEVFPPGIPVDTLSLDGSSPAHQLAGLVAQMYFVNAIGQALGKDPGRPSVPDFGRTIHYADISTLIPPPGESKSALEQSKYEVLGARWPAKRDHGSMRRAAASFAESIEQTRFRAIIFDYDGTLCSSQKRKRPPSTPILNHLVRLVNAGVVVGIVSGRGGSIQECLQDSLPPEVLPRIWLGLYNGGWIADAATPARASGAPSEFLSQVTRIIVRLKSIGAPIEEYKTTYPLQVSVRFRDGVKTDDMWFVIADAMRQAGLDISGIVKSKHSVDVLAPGIRKSELIAHVIRVASCDPYQILTMGDQGAWPGNDSGLLEHRFSLSVDVPSRRLDRGWKLAPVEKRDVDATMWYLDRVTLEETGFFRIALSMSVDAAGGSC